MKRIFVVVVSIFVLGFSFGAVDTYANPHQEEKGEPIQLTEKQQKDLAKLHEDMFETHKKLINKYVEFGVMPKEKGDKIINRMEERLAQLKENGYVPNWDKKCKDQSGHDDDDE